MGCCVSSERDASSPRIGSQGHSSSQAIASQSVHRPSTSSHSARPPRHSIHRAEEPPDARINQPLRLLTWKDKNHQWTRAEIDAERIAFFDTRVDGRSEIWQTIHAALEILWQGGDPEDIDGGISTAQAMLNGAGITNPYGHMSTGLFDETGKFYALPRHIIADPTNLVEQTETVAGPAKAEDEGEADHEVDKSEESDGTDEEVLRHREAKGKAVVDPKAQIELRARRSDGVPGDVVINVSKKDSIEVVARRLCVAAGLRPTQSMRLHCRGKLYRDEKSSLEDFGWQEGWLVNAQILDTA